MRYKSFRIQNFKGIKDTTIEVQGFAGANVFALVGLNESGKTTVLEAIHSFSPDDATSELLAGEKDTGVPFPERVPRHLISEFSGYVSVTATLTVTAEDKEHIAKYLKSQDLIIDVDRVPDEIVFERQQLFKDGDFKKSYFTLRTPFFVKTGRQRTWREPTAAEGATLRNGVYNFTPDIAYFPTFVFDFPEAFYLTDRGGTVDRFYRRVFQDILDYDARGHTIEKDIVRRVRDESMVVPWLRFLNMWRDTGDADKIDHVMDRAGAAVTRLIFGRWNKIFGEDTKGKELVISYEIVEGEVRDRDGTASKTQKHDVLVKFKIKDGSRRFNVNDRSLGFRWFFSFMLFTQFRVARSQGVQRPLLFLFDEPASNLHAAAQQKLIESFPQIAKGEHVLAYSTHSHYMIEPKWLEQTFIVTNRSDAPETSVLDEVSLDDESLDVQVSPYRRFVNSNPTKTSYFQPILDRLSVVPSKFDVQRSSIIVEGKSDYYILRYAQKLTGTGDISIIPGVGAGTFSALVSLHVAWNLNLLFVLDGDAQGKKERVRYIDDLGILPERIVTLDELSEEVVEIEDLLDKPAREMIKDDLQLAQEPTKAQISRFFQERLANDNVKPLGAYFGKNAKALLSALASRLDASR